jgi:hypothetical protein
MEALDLMDPASIDAFAGRFLAAGRPLRMLIDSAGIMANPLTRDARGYQAQVATNHLGHFQLALRLWPALRRAEGARVVSVSSRARRFADTDFDDQNYEHRAYDKWAYGQSKTANALLALGLDARGETKEAKERWGSFRHIGFLGRIAFAGSCLKPDARLERNHQVIKASGGFRFGPRDLGFHLRRVEIVEARAELAGDADASIVADHVPAILRREAAHHGHDPGLRAAAFLMHAQALEHPHAPLVEEAIKQSLARNGRIDKLVVLDCPDEGLGLCPGIVLRWHGQIIRRMAFRDIARR